MERKEIYIVKIFDGAVESFYFSTKELAKQFMNKKKEEFKNELSGFKMQDLDSMISFEKDDESYAIILEKDYLDFQW